MRRLSLRTRLALVFALAMAAVLAAVAIVVHVRLGSTLLEQVDERLEARSTAIAARAFRLDGGGDDELAQLLERDGAVVASSTGEVAVVEGLVPAADGLPRYVTRDALPELGGDPARFLLTPAGDGILVVGASLEEREEALAGLARELALVLPLALVAATGAGYLLATAALRPVEAMRRRAAAITSDNVSYRLPVGSADDEIARLGVTLNEMLARLEDGLARERRFVADASHELRTPLALLQTELELALRRPRSREELEAAIRSATRETERLSRLAEDLLVLATADRGTLPLRLEALPAGELLDTVVRRFAARAEAEGRVLTSAADEIGVHADRLRVEQALGNLVDNALRHGSGAIRVVAAERDGDIELRVADEGSFPAEEARRAFEPFTRGDDARSGGGAGLGLAIVAAVARAHGGTARVGEDAGGTAVVLGLPTIPPREEANPAPTGSRGTSPSPTP